MISTPLGLLNTPPLTPWVFCGDPQAPYLKKVFQHLHSKVCRIVLQIKRVFASLSDMHSQPERIVFPSGTSMKKDKFVPTSHRRHSVIGQSETYVYCRQLHTWAWRSFQSRVVDYIYSMKYLKPIGTLRIYGSLITIHGGLRGAPSYMLERHGRIHKVVDYHTTMALHHCMFHNLNWSYLWETGWDACSSLFSYNNVQVAHFLRGNIINDLRFVSSTCRG